MCCVLHANYAIYVKRATCALRVSFANCAMCVRVLVMCAKVASHARRVIRYVMTVTVAKCAILVVRHVKRVISAIVAKRATLDAKVVSPVSYVMFVREFVRPARTALQPKIVKRVMSASHVKFVMHVMVVARAVKLVIVAIIVYHVRIA